MLRAAATALAIGVMLGAAQAQQKIELNAIQDRFELPRPHIDSVEAVKDGQYWTVVFKFSTHQLSAPFVAELRAFSKRNLGKRIQWAVGDRIVAFSVIGSEIAGHTFNLGHFSEAEAKDIVAKLRR